jgi:hypothetical protein
VIEGDDRGPLSSRFAGQYDLSRTSESGGETWGQVSILRF